MRLTKIKLAGFKSFVDPTTISLISNLSAIVGPNGCGKSNVIDAVRWVMGESSSKHLRAGASSDVIFSGSAARKPVGQASVELIFDNSDGSLGGEYAKFSELSIRRQVTRDGQSVYYLNGTRCRKRDITDVFAGTGLGPRSYAIINQGMGSSLVEAKPDELRVFLEEAAGISKYKERRKEAQNRIRHTLENLDRVGDLQGELEKQLEHLAHQAQTAQKHKEYTHEQRTLKAQLATMTWKRLDDALSEMNSHIQDKEHQYQGLSDHTLELDTRLEKQRTLQHERQEEWQLVQKKFFQLDSEISRCEQNIDHHCQRKTQLQNDIEEAHQKIREFETQNEQDIEQKRTIEENLEQLNPQIEATQSRQQSAFTALKEKEGILENCQNNWQHWQKEYQHVLGRSEVEKAKISQIEKQFNQLQTKKEKWTQHLNELNETTLTQSLDELQLQVRGQEESVLDIQDQIQDKTQLRDQHRQHIEQLKSELQTSQNTWQKKQGTLASLEALQKAAFEQDDGQVTDWMDSHQLGALKRLAQEVQVESHWSMALEMVLGEFLEGIVLSDEEQWKALSSECGQLTSGSVVLLNLDSAQADFNVDPNSLLAKVTTQNRLSAYLKQRLNTIYVQEDIETALSCLESLEPQGSCITPEGLWIGHGWVRLKKGQTDPLQGSLQRERERQDTQEQVVSLSKEIEVQKENLVNAQKNLEDIEFERDCLQDDKTSQARRLAELKGSLKEVQGRLTQLRQQRHQLTQEVHESEGQLNQWQQELKQSRQILDEAIETIARFSDQEDQLKHDQVQAKETVEHHRTLLRQVREQSHEMALLAQKETSKLEALLNGLERGQRLKNDLAQKIENLEQSLASTQAPIEENQLALEQLTASRIHVEKQVVNAKENLEACEQGIKSLEKERHQQASHQESIRLELEKLKLQCQGDTVLQQGVIEQIEEMEVNIPEVLESLPDEASESTWQKQIKSVQRKLDALGPVNLAAIEEHGQAKERKEYLEAQGADLNEALETLQAAIEKIDKQTKRLFKDTFEKVNDGLKDLFPRLFGGGEAYLQLMSEDLLETGVALIARPPGKRISTIHQLSGGEKALTAVAMVFAIFLLNPAPFCMLDEVDAPLDDRNVGRFCDLVNHMSKSVQFIYISHNKLAMEMAQQLQGVTMREPGVSRIVTVDVVQATSMANA